MPAVSLGDLMNPLVKMQRYSEESNMVLTSLSDFLVITVSSMKNTQQRLLMIAAAQADLLSMIEKNTGKTLFSIIGNLLGLRARMIFRSRVVKGLDNIAKLLKGGTKAKEINVKDKSVSSFIKDAGIGLFNFARALAKAAFIKKEGVDKFIGYVQRIMVEMRKFAKDKDIIVGAENFVKFSVKFNRALFGKTVFFGGGVVGAAEKLSGKVKKINTKNIDTLFKFINKVITESKKLVKTGGEKGAQILFNVGVGLSKFGAAIRWAGIFSPFMIIGTTILTLAIRLVGNSLISIGKKHKELKNGANALKMISKPLMFFTAALSIVGAVMLVTGDPSIFLKAIFVMSLAIVGLGTATALIGSFGKSVVEGSKAVRNIGQGLVGLAKGLILLLLVAPLLLIIPPKALFLMFAVIVGLGGAMALIGLQDKNVKKGSKAAESMGKALKSIAIGIALLAAVSLLVPYAKPTLLLIAGLSLTFFFLGKFDKQIKKGGVSMLIMSISLALFAIGYMYFADATKSVTMMQAITQLIIVGGFVIVSIIAGKFFMDVIKGSGAIAVLGLGLMLFSMGYKPFAQATSGLTIMDALTQVIIVGGLVIAALIAGLMFMDVIKGSLAIGVLGIGLMIFSIGYKPFAQATKGITVMDALAQVIIVGGLVVAALIAGLAFVQVLLGSIAIGVLGIGLMLFSVGYKPFAKAVKGITIQSALAQVILIGGFVVSALIAGLAFVPVLLGSIAIGVLGIGLMLFSIGYKPFAKVTKDETIETATAKIMLVGGLVAISTLAGLAIIPIALSVLSFAFISLGLFALSFGLKYIKATGWNKGDTDNLVYALSNILMAFGGNPPGGAGSGQGGGILGFLGTLGESIGKIITSGLGALNVVVNALSFIVISGALIALAEGLKVFKSSGWTPGDTDILRGVLKMLMDVFGAGSGEKPKGGGGLIASALNLGSKVISTVTAGVGTVSTLFNAASLLTISQILPPIAAGLKTFADANWTAAKTENLRHTIKSLMDIFTNQKGSIGKQQVQELGIFVNHVERIGKLASNGSLDKTAKGIEKIVSSINKIDVEKTNSLTKFFKASSEFTENKKSEATLKALAEAVEEIRDLLVSDSTKPQNTGTGGISGLISNAMNAVSPTKAAPVATSPENNANLSSILSQINSTLANLPAQIAAIEIKVRD